LADQGRNFGAGYGVVANVGGYDVGGQLDTTALVGVISHVGPDSSRIIFYAPTGGPSLAGFMVVGAPSRSLPAKDRFVILPRQ
jgi:hypothetical protein